MNRCTLFLDWQLIELIATVFNLCHWVNSFRVGNVYQESDL